MSGLCLANVQNNWTMLKLNYSCYVCVYVCCKFSGMTNNEADFEMCFRSENVILPPNGYFGVSAATGGLADDHDVIHFLTSSLHVPGIDQARKLIILFSLFHYFIFSLFYLDLLFLTFVIV